jgi:hypothetical protein
LGLLQDNEKPFHYLGNDTIVNQESIWWTPYDKYIDSYTYAPTIWEIMEVLPDVIEDKRYTYWITIDKSSQLGYCVYYRSYIDLKYYRDKSLPNSLAKMLVWVIESGYLDINKQDG